MFRGILHSAAILLCLLYCLGPDTFFPLPKMVASNSPKKLNSPKKQDSEKKQGSQVEADWVFHSLSNPKIPDLNWNSIKNGPLKEESSFTSIDAFLLKRLDENKLSYRRLADRITLLRRVTMDLIGLPPTPQEIKDFLEDRSKNAYEKVVDRLLASPRFGERMALWWLDVVRYAETDGFKADDPRPNAWRYRDYVIESFNQDKPYDRFLMEQLAGDEIDPENIQARIATAFLRHYPDEYNAVNLTQRRQEILNDITDTTAQGFMGLTMGCARCHDHKFDPITQEDYYRLQAFFVGWNPVSTSIVSAEEQKKYERDLQKWQSETAKIREQIRELEKPYREKITRNLLKRFPDEFAQLIDIPVSERTPLQKQIAEMMGKQINAEDKKVVGSMKKEEKTKVERLYEELKKFGPAPKRPESTPGMTDIGKVLPDTYVLKRGSLTAQGKKMTPGFLSAIDDRDAEILPIVNKNSSGRRTALAQWLIRPDNPLTSRVIVNRLWQHHFGRGIVASSGDFGAQGDRPSHPELLDWLAQQLIQQRWHLKPLHKMMVMSYAYRQSSKAHEDGLSKDPENRLLWRMNRRILEGEAIRDSILSATGEIHHALGGPSVFPELPEEIQPKNWTLSKTAEERNRRSIYVYVKRNLRYPIFSAFDAPDRNETCSRRFTTTTAPQALMLLNDPWIIKRAEALANRLRSLPVSDLIASASVLPSELTNKKSKLDPLDPKSDQAANNESAWIVKGYQLTLSRSPTNDEFEVAQSYFSQQLRQGRNAKEILIDFCHVLLNLNEFMYID